MKQIIYFISFILMVGIVFAVTVEVGHYDMNGDSVDISDTGNDGVDTDMSYVSGKISDAGSWNALTSQIRLLDDAAQTNIWDGGGALSVWLYADSDGEGSAGTIAIKYSGNAWSMSTRDESGGNVRIVFDYAFSTTYGVWQTTNLDLPLGGWHHLVINYDTDATANNPTIYIDGSSKGITRTSTPAGTRKTDSGYPFIIGEYVGGQFTFDGEMDDFRIFTRTLTAGEIAELYNGGTGTETPLGAGGGGSEYPTINVVDSNYSNYLTTGTTLKVNATFADDVGLSSYFMSNNQTGSWSNSTNKPMSGTGWVANETLDITATTGTNVAFLWYVNDSDNQWNVSEPYTVVVKDDIRHKDFKYEALDGSTLLTLYGNGDLKLEGILYAAGVIEMTEPYLTDTKTSLDQIKTMDLSTKESIHKTSPTECSYNGGTNLNCLVKSVIQSLKQIELNYQSLVKFVKDNNFQRKNDIQKIQLELDSCKSDITKLNKNIYEILQKQKIDIPSFDKTNVTIISDIK